MGLDQISVGPVLSNYEINDRNSLVYSHVRFLSSASVPTGQHSMNAWKSRRDASNSTITQPAAVLTSTVTGTPAAACRGASNSRDKDSAGTQATAASADANNSSDA